MRQLLYILDIFEPELVVKSLNFTVVLLTNPEILFCSIFLSLCNEILMYRAKISMGHLLCLLFIYSQTDSKNMVVNNSTSARFFPPKFVFVCQYIYITV